MHGVGSFVCLIEQPVDAERPDGQSPAGSEHPRVGGEDRPGRVAGAEVASERRFVEPGRYGQEPDVELAPLGPATARLHLRERTAGPPAARAPAVGAGFASAQRVGVLAQYGPPVSPR